MAPRGRQPIVVGVDGSAASEEALRWAAGQAELTGAELRVITAWRLPVTYGYPPTTRVSATRTGPGKRSMPRSARYLARRHGSPWTPGSKKATLPRFSSPPRARRTCLSSAAAGTVPSRGCCLAQRPSTACATHPVPCSSCRPVRPLGAEGSRADRPDPTAFPNCGSQEMARPARGERGTESVRGPAPGRCDRRGGAGPLAARRRTKERLGAPWHGLFGLSGTASSAAHWRCRPRQPEQGKPGGLLGRAAGRDVAVRRR